MIKAHPHKLTKVVKAVATFVTRHHDVKVEHTETEEQRAERERLVKDYDRTHPPGIDRVTGCC